MFFYKERYFFAESTYTDLFRAGFFVSFKKMQPAFFDMDE